jgi:hypothetical protein
MVRRRASQARPVGVVAVAVAVGSCRPSALRSRTIHHTTGAGRMNDVLVIGSWFGERLNVRNVDAADADAEGLCRAPSPPKPTPA